MSFSRKQSDFGVRDNDDDDNQMESQPQFETIDLDDLLNQDGYDDEPTPSEPLYGDLESPPSASAADIMHPPPRYMRSASISVSTEPTSTGLSFILDMDKEEAVEHTQSLHDDIEKMFDKTPSFSLGDLLSSGGDSHPSERGHEVTEVGMSHDRFTEDYDISSHRRSSFPHIHVPLKSLPNHSLKSFNTLVEDDKPKERKHRRKKRSKPKEPKKSKSSIFPSQTASLSPAIPEVEREEYSESEESSNEDDADESSRLLLDDPDGEQSQDQIRQTQSEPIQIRQIRSEPDATLEPLPLVEISATPQSFPGATVATTPDDDQSMFYIGTENNSMQVSASSSVVSSQANFLTSVPATTPVVIVLNDQDKPLISTNGDALVSTNAQPYLNLSKEEKYKVKFLLGEEDEEMGFAKQEGDEDAGDDDDDDDDDDKDDDDEDDDDDDEEKDEKEEEEAGDKKELVWIKFEDEEYQKNLKKDAPPPKIHRSDSKHKHYRQKEHYKPADLLRRRQRGSEVQLCHSDSSKHLPTEQEEAETLPSVDLDEMASHRMENLQGFQKHKVRGHKKRKTVSSVVYIGSKEQKTKRKYFKQSKKTFDHTSHEVFVELDELFMNEDHREVEWREKARWIKFEEDVEEGAERWGKPHVASLSFHSLIELRKGLEHGSLILDLEATDLTSIIHRVVDSMVIHDQIPSEVKGQVMRTLLTKHKFVEGEGTVKSLIRRNVSSLNLTDLGDRHQRAQLSIMKTLSSASFANISSASNLQALAHQNHSNHSNQNSNNHLIQRSNSEPDHQNDVNLNSTPLTERKSSRKEKKDKKKSRAGEPGRVEFVKVDIDNNTATQDGVHIGLVPQEADQKDTRTSDQKTSLMRRIPRDAEACTVLVGHVDYLEKPAMAFVRLAEKQVLENLTEVPLPVRFVFVLLGPETEEMDYHEVGRSISTLMSNQHFHEIAYKAETRSEILHAINEFLNESIVLPPGDWDQKTLLPVMDMARKRAKLRRRKIKKQEEFKALLEKEEKHKIPMDPVKRTGRLFGGLINDIRRRYPHYRSDIVDALNFPCAMALIFIFFACLAPCLAFGGLIGEKTHRQIGVTETIISTSFTNIVFALFAGQPVILYGATGPVLVFEKHLYAFCEASHIDFLTWRVWVGMWVLIISLVVTALEGSYIIRYFTRFTEEIFAILIALIFIFEVKNKLTELYTEHPLMLKEFYCDSYMASNDSNHTTTLLPGNYTDFSANSTSNSSNVSYVLNVTESVINSNGTDGADREVIEVGHYGKAVNKNEPNTALLSTILIFGTFLVAYFLRIFRNSTFLGRSARRALGDFGIFIAIVGMVTFDFICADTFTQKLDIPPSFGHTDGTDRSWLINPLGQEKKMEIWLMFMAIVPGFLFFLLLFLELQLTEMLLHKKEFKLKKGTGFHLDQFILGFMVFLQSLFGLPWMCPATVRSVAHVSALSIMSRTHAPGEKPKLMEVKDQRVTNFVMNILIGTTLMWGPVLRAVPMAVMFGVFLYLGVSAISGVQLYKRIKLLFMPVKHHPGKSYVRRVRTFKMNIFTMIQVILVAILWVVKSTKAAIAFPLFVFALAPLRLKLMPRFFTHDELEVLDKEEEDSDDEEDTDPDFYQMAHMPI